jgi:hypothetical protein
MNLPAELWQQIIGELVAEYIDVAIMEWSDVESAEGLPQNFVIPLLRVSRRMRSYTILILADALGARNDVSSR